jgi:eukaryotic-like serine/threonine-protein kinase
MPSSQDETLGGDPGQTSVGEVTIAGDREPSSSSPSGGERGARTVLEPGDSVGRYVVLTKLGAGGMGVVYAAYDPELDRKIALKVLRSDPRTWATNSSDGHLRLLREAQALAKFSHPNIVTVHDVGEHASGVWIAMEYVEGETLAGWAKQPRSWLEVLRVMVAAGRGVQAAHASGLVHRDLKPDNIMIGKDGRVRVMDFGLTRTLAPYDSGSGSGEPRANVANTEQTTTLDPLATPVTQFGSLLGTPAYMSPEQFAGITVSEASDQFSFCVTLWELLYGVRPFQGKTTMALGAAVLDGSITPPPARGIPAWLSKALRRGLAVDPGGRWPSMDALLTELDSGQQRRGRRLAALAGLGLVAVIAGAVAADRYQTRQFEAGCASEGAEVSAVWNDEVRARVRAGLLATEVGNAEATVERVMPWLDRYAAGWAEAKTARCLAGREPAPALADQLERADWCLEHRLTSLAALLEQLTHADKATVYAAIPAAVALPNLDACGDEQTLANQPIPAADQRGAIRAVQMDLARASVLAKTGKRDEGLALAEQALASAEAIEWIPLRAKARAQVGQLLRGGARGAEAEPMLEQAFFEALDAGSYEDAFTVAIEVSTIAGAHKGSGLRDGERWLRLADWLDHRLGDSRFRQAAVLNARGVLAMAGGDFKTGLASYASALERSEAELGAEHPLVAANLLNLANANFRTGNYAEALRHYDRAIAMYETTLGAEHPMLALAVANSVNSHKGLGDYERALAVGERALAMRIALHGRNHVEVGTVLESLANIHSELNDYAKAAETMAEVLAVTEATAGTEGAVYARNLINLGALQVKTGAYAEAKANFARSLDIHEALYGPDSMMPFYSLVNLAEVSLALDEDAEALAYAERATKLGEQMGVDPEAIGEATFFLAQALWRADPRSTRARTVAAQARDHYQAGGVPTQARLAEAEAFLARIGGG